MGIFHPPVSGDTQNGSQLLGWKILELNFGTRFSHKILDQFQMPHKILAHKRKTKNEMAHKMENQRDFFFGTRSSLRTKNKLFIDDISHQAIYNEPGWWNIFSIYRQW